MCFDRSAPSSPISVIIPVYNGAPYLGEAIESVLSQTVRPAEILVIDDGSTDCTAQVAKSYPVRYICQSHQGVSVARNFGVAQSHGKLIAFLDADDLWLPHKLATQLEVLQTHPEVEAVFGQVEQFGTIENGERTRSVRFVGEAINAPHVGTMLIRRDAFLRVGGFEPRWLVAQFVDWYARAEEANLRMHFFPEVLLRRRVHGKNLTLHMKQIGEREYLQVLTEKLSRRRYK